MGALIGLGCVALALFFLMDGFSTPEEVIGVFVPTAVGMLALGVAVLALAPLRWGDSFERTPQMIVRLLLGVALLGAGVTAAAVVRGDWPYVLVAALPLAAVGAVLRDARRFRRLARTSGAPEAA
ncbi:hypothetical protein [Nocardioides sp.]|uniref:hypothetical protein n=1 Tax=Nocardioides sp. TaxID=35761 RepID=UPI0035199362